MDQSVTRPALDIEPVAAAADTPEETVGMWTRIVRGAQTIVGWVLMLAGLPLSFLPLHLGLPLLLLGLILVLRSSVKAKRKFIEQQQKRPRVLFPIRRLLRRDPE